MGMFADIPWDIIVIQTVNGIVTGMILALVASGLTLIFGIMDVVNFAHGELFMLGAYIGVVVLAATGSFWLALVLATLIVALLGAALQIDDVAAAARPRSADHDPRHLRHLAGAAELRAVAVRPGAAQDPGAVHRPVRRSSTSQYPWYRLLIAVLSAAIIGGLYLFLKYGTYGIWIRATTQDRVMAQAMGIPVPWVHTAVFAIGAGMAAASGVLFGPLVGVNHAMGLDWVLKAFIVVVVGGMGNLGGSIAASIFISLLEAYAVIPWLIYVACAQPGAGGHRLLRRADPHPAVPAHRPLRADTQMSNARATLPSTGPAFGIVIALLIVAPLVLPEFWRRFLTEILIWGLLAMSSDILIGYTGMVSFGHSAFFGLGMYGAAAALLMVKPPNLWLAILYGLAARAGVGPVRRLFLHPAARHLFRHHARLIFSQIFYVIIFTWTEVTGGENGLTFSRPQLGIPGVYTCRSPPRRCTGSCWRS